MKYREYKNKQELAIYIISELERTIKLMGNSDGLQSSLDMFRAPKAKKKDLIAKKQDIIEKYKLIKKGKLWTY